MFETRIEPEQLVSSILTDKVFVSIVSSKLSDIYVETLTPVAESSGDQLFTIVDELSAVVKGLASLSFDFYVE